MSNGWTKRFIVFFMLFSANVGAHEIGNLRHVRYCEVIVWLGKLQFAVYNTTGLNDCPDEQWRKLNKRDIETQLNSHFVYLNGPRYWVIDGFKNSTFVDPKVVTFNGLGMREAGVLHMSLLGLITPHKPYHSKIVDRKTTFVFKANKPVYELIDPAGKVYVMQSYSVQKVSQTDADLSTLGQRLTLPKGWRFCTGSLKSTAYLTAVDTKAEVVQDDFWNSYELQTDPAFTTLVEGC